MDQVNQSSTGENLRAQILKALDGLVVLNVTTVVGQATVSDVNSSGTVSTVKLTDPNPKIANTVVNTALGDGTTIFSPEFLSDPLLTAAHQSAVDAAHKVRKETIDMLKTVLSDFKDLLFPRPGAAP